MSDSIDTTLLVDDSWQPPSLVLVKNSLDMSDLCSFSGDLYGRAGMHLSAACV